ncbi:hypothetical protein VTN00DRAFT_9376 [Thermoascus crustaceus]|uniref:uncharacterized protein n=1 Tax=Thermoascus crustaceus TaxID=5088 RepID=UPI0037448347
MSPLIEQYVLMNKDQPQWTLPTADAETLCRDCFISLAEHGHEATLQSLWMILTDKLLEAVKLSSPEQSRDFKASQDSICTQANRLFTLQTAVIRRLSGSGIEPRTKEIFEKPGLPLLENSLHVLRSRNGKPYGAAAVVEEAIRNIPQVAKCSTGLAAFVRDDIPDLLFSPSADRLMAIMLECRRWAGFESSFEKSVEKVVETEAEELNVPFLEKLLSTIDFKEVKDISGLESKIMQSLKRACRGSRLHWPIIAAVVGNPTSHGELSDRIFLSLVDSLSEDETSLEALHGLSLIASRGQTALQRFRNGDHGSKLLAKLLYLTESPSDEVAHLAESLEKKTKSMVAKDTSARSNLEILQHSFSQVSIESLSVESLINIAKDLIRNAAPEEKPQVAASVFPSQESWKSAMEPFLGLPPRASTAITGVLGGVVYLVDRGLSGSSRQKLESVPRDSDRCSSAFRLTSYVTKILSSSKIVEFLRPEERNTLFYYLPLAIQLIDDDLSIEGCNGITGLEMPEEREEYLEIVSQGRTLVNNWIRSESPLDSENGASLGATMAAFWEQKLEALEDTSPESYRVGEAFIRIMSERDSLSMSNSTDFLTNLSKQIRTSNAVRSAAWIAVLRPSLVSIPAGTRLCNELISDATGLDPKNKQSEGLRTLSLLNLLAEGDDVVAASAQTQRLVFLVKHLIQCFQSGIESLNVKAEVIKLLSVILPKLAEIYGSHWADTLEILNSTWKETSGGDEGLSVLYASFRLFGRLRLMANGESNDDFEDAWSESKDDLVRNLVSTLSRIDSSTAFHQPRDVTADLLCRLTTTIPVESLKNVSEIFPLLTAQTRGIQRSAYEVLHRYIPKTQEQVSFDVALTKSTVRLPEELLSLLREAPTMESISSSYGEEKTWIRLRAYLLSWKVVFDYFSNASLTVQENYASSIKENDILNPLLEFAFDFLQKSHGKLVDASKFDVRSFEPGASDSSEKETQWLLVHLYFLSLKHLANLTKTWWIDSKKRIKGVVEMWTEKFISPLIIEDSLKSVSEWITTQDPDEERALSVKVSPKTAELVASIPVDEESPPVAISISLPPAYPLQPALVTGRSRVLVDEKKWRSWVLTIQGVIMFSNGNLVDGLLAFRKNVQGALKGQSECAICYSVISTDMQTPNKRCATCKNTFHSVCLFRWFKSSNQSTCPLCRNNFVYV